MKIQFLYHEMIIKQKEYNDIKKINIMIDIIFAKSFNNYLKEKDKINKKDLKIKNNSIDDNNRRIALIKKKNQIKMEYKIDKGENKIKILCGYFVNINRKKCYIVNNGKKYKLKEYFNIKKNIKYLLKIRLIGINNVINLKGMFFKCISLISIKDISNWNINNVTDMSLLFYNCAS